MAFGQLKRRFSINKTGYRIATDKIPSAIISTMILHNIAIDYRLPNIEENLDDDQQQQQQDNFEQVAGQQEFLEMGRNRQVAINRRNELANRFE